MNYIFLLISYGMNVGVFYAISTLLNRVSMQIELVVCVVWSCVDYQIGTFEVFGGAAGRECERQPSDWMLLLFGSVVVCVCVCVWQKPATHFASD